MGSRAAASTIGPVVLAAQSADTARNHGCSQAFPFGQQELGSCKPVNAWQADIPASTLLSSLFAVLQKLMHLSVSPGRCVPFKCGNATSLYNYLHNGGRPSGRPQAACLALNSHFLHLSLWSCSIRGSLMVQEMQELVETTLCTSTNRTLHCLCSKYCDTWWSGAHLGYCQMFFLADFGLATFLHPRASVNSMRPRLAQGL